MTTAELTYDEAWDMLTGFGVNSQDRRAELLRIAQANGRKSFSLYDYTYTIRARRTSAFTLDYGYIIEREGQEQ